MMFRAAIASLLVILLSAPDETYAQGSTSPVAAPVVTSPVGAGTPSAMPFFSFTLTNAPVAGGTAPVAASPVASSTVAPAAATSSTVAPAAATSSTVAPAAATSTTPAPVAAGTSSAPAVPSSTPPVVPGTPTIGPLPPGTTLPPILAQFTDLGICSVCGDGYIIDNPAGMVSVAGYNFTCEEAQLAGDIGAFPKSFCNDGLTETFILPACGCQLATKAPVTPPVPPTPAPVVDNSAGSSMVGSIMASITAAMAALIL